MKGKLNKGRSMKKIFRLEFYIHCIVKHVENKTTLSKFISKSSSEDLDSELYTKSKRKIRSQADPASVKILQDE